MTNKKSVEEEKVAVSSKLNEIEERLDIMHNSFKELNSAIDMLVRFSMTAKAFMEISISQGLIDPHELNRLASTYEDSYAKSLNIGENIINTSNFSKTRY